MTVLAGLALAFEGTFSGLMDVVVLLVLSTGAALMGFLATTAAFGAGLLASFTTDLATRLATGSAIGFFDVFEGIVGLRMTKIYPQGKSAQNS